MEVYKKYGHTSVVVVWVQSRQNHGMIDIDVVLYKVLV